MDADESMEQIREISLPEDLDKVDNALKEYRLKILGDFNAAIRIQELRDGSAKGVTQAEVFTSVRALVRKA